MRNFLHLLFKGELLAFLLPLMIIHSNTPASTQINFRAVSYLTLVSFGISFPILWLRLAVGLSLNWLWNVFDRLANYFLWFLIIFIFFNYFNYSKYLMFNCICINTFLILIFSHGTTCFLYWSMYVYLVFKCTNIHWSFELCY